MNVGVSIPLPAYLVDPAFIARTAEDLGFESFWCAEHPFIPVNSASRFPSSPDGVTSLPCWRGSSGPLQHVDARTPGRQRRDGRGLGASIGVEWSLALSAPAVVVVVVVPAGRRRRHPLCLRSSPSRMSH